ncbi:MAG: translocation/assembly module TamB domain-containing protein, partial [Bacteroidota bacterium]
MKEKKVNTRFKTFRKIVLRTLLVLLLLILLSGIALSLPSVQTKIAHYFTEQINEDFGTDIYIDQVEVTIFGGVQLKKVMIKDDRKDTLIYANRITTSILDASKLLDGNLIFGNIRANDLTLNIKTYKNEKDSNLDKFIAAFDDGKKSSGKFLMTSNKITVINSRFIKIDENATTQKEVDFTYLNAVVTNFKILGPNVTTKIENMAFKDHRGLFVENLTSNFAYTKKNIRLDSLELKTKNSKFNGDVVLNYNMDNHDFSDFNNRVVFDIKAKGASLATNDIRYFYKELAPNQKFYFSGKIDGTLNDFKIKNLNLLDNNNSQIIGDVHFKNLLAKKGKGEFYMKGSFDKVASSYNDLAKLLPNVLGKSLPTSLKKLGKFNLIGDAEVTTTSIDADFKLQTKLGNVISQLVMTNINNIDNASYSGNITLDNFDIGAYLNRSDIGKVSMSADVEGKGFTEKYLDVQFSTEVQSIRYNGYTYQNILADGSFKKPIFKGKVNVNDPNLFLDFDGTVDLSKKEKKYDFNAKIDYVNLKKLNFINDSIAIFKGDIVMNVYGNSINDMKGNVAISNASYQNSKKQYFFDKLDVNSTFDENNVHKITFKSEEGIDGYIEGKFDFNQIYNMVENSIGSLYTNYKPNIIKKGQYFKFNFTNFSELVEIVMADISLSEDAVLSGKINGDDNDFKLNFNTTKLTAFDTQFDKIQLEVDNKNPLYNTYIQMDSIKLKQYKIRDFSLINVTSKDTLNFRTEFKGGETGTDFYKLNLYHTINSDKKNVVGFYKSEMMFKDFLWYLNENNDEKNKITFDKNFTEFNFEELIVSHENQSLRLNGEIIGKNNKDLQLTFKEVNLNKITPNVDKFKFDGNVNGEIYLKQNNSVYQPTASLTINKLFVNDNELGNMSLAIDGNNDFSKFNISSTIENENFESFKADGDLQIVNEQTLLDIDLNFKKFNLGVLSNLGGDVLSNIRGFVSGNARIDGNVNNIDYNGRLFVDGAGLTVPYLNVDYEIKPNSIIDVTQEKFIIQRTKITDTKYKTEGNLEGFIKHKQFGDWELNLNIDSKRLLALDTKDHEDAAYFGTAYIDGEAVIAGPTTGLVINVTAKSEKGTDVKIPINDAVAVEDSQYITFLTPNEKYNLGKATPQATRNYSGLQMNFEFDITKDANIEVILDRDSGHGMKGVGEGQLLFRINTRGNFNMWGDFVVERGSYNFKYGGLVDKRFDVRKNGYISWSGDPFNAVLNLEAVYLTSANPAVLIDNPSFNKKIPVEVSIDLKGTLNNPEPDFNINFPNVSSVLKSEIETKLSDKDTRQTQALY